jgi:hypothetical protein
MNTTKHVLGDRVLVRHVTAPLPRNGKCAVQWLPGELISAERWYGRERYVALLDDGRRLLAFDEEVRARPQWPSLQPAPAPTPAHEASHAAA